MMLKESEAKDLFEDIQPKLVKLVLSAWAKVAASDLRLSDRGRANAMWDEMTHNAANEFAGNDSIRIEPINNKQSVAYWLNDHVLFRLKKANKKGYTSNYQTQAAMDFHDQPLQMDMFGEPTKLEVIYQLDNEAVEVTDVNVVHRTINFIDYMFSLNGNSDVVAMPAKTAPAKPAGDSNIVKLKASDAKKKSEQGDDE